MRSMYKLTVQIRANGARTTPRYHYRVVDLETGRVVSERKSNRRYVAATLDSRHYFSRVDLIGKGLHGKLVKILRAAGLEPALIAYLEK